MFGSADVLSGRHIVRCFLDILSGSSSDILSGLLGSAPDILSGRLRIRHIVRRTFYQDWMDLVAQLDLKILVGGGDPL